MGVSSVGPPVPEAVYLSPPPVFLTSPRAQALTGLILSLCSKRYDAQIQDYERKSEQHREALGRLQQEFQRTQGKVSVKT